MLDIFNEPLIWIMAALIALVLFLVIVVFWLLHRLKKYRRNYGKILEAADRQAGEIVSNARLKAQDILRNAENNAGKYLTGKESEIEKLHAEFQERLEDLSERMKNNFSENVRQVSQLSEGISKEMEKSMNSATKEAVNGIQELSSKAQTNLQEELQQVKNSANSINRSLEDIENSGKEVKENFSKAVAKMNTVSEEASSDIRERIEVSAKEAEKAINGVF
ncbi:MAG: hypothetical protein ACLFTS_02000, partial [Candidatus Paceibacterota bacterium]